MTLRRVVVIVGPTATGKSASALELARRLGGEIVNGDSRQVYRGMDIGTAKPAMADRKLVRHHLFDVADPRETYSLALYRNQARAAFESIWNRGSFPWLVGGSGQYIWALLENWSVPEVAPDPDLRARLEALALSDGASALHARLAAVDPLAAERIDARNVRRVIRALEVFEHTGVPISTWQTKSDPDFEYLLYGLDAPQEDLLERIDRRTDAMFSAGFVDEVQTLLAAGVAPDAAAMASIGYSDVVAYLAGEQTLPETIERTKIATRQLVRRQRQWFRRDDRRIHWVRDFESIELEANIFTGACTNVIRGERR